MDAERILIVVAHPDDETIGAGIWMARRPSCDGITLLHVTDGSPRNLSDARSAGFATREEYAAERRRELLAAVGLAGIRPEQCRALGFVDQEASFDLRLLVASIRDVIAELKPGLILTHPYEGGHPDHDACAFAVAQALKRAPHYEFVSYHNGPAGLIPGKFLREEGSEEILTLSPAERELKTAMFECFRTQKRVLDWFSIDQERFRIAPKYDFTQPPHEGELLYERFGFATGDDWRRSATYALEMSTSSRF